MTTVEKLKRDAIDIFLAGVAAVEPGRAVMQHLSLDGNTLIAGGVPIHLAPATRVFVVGAGKAGAPMAAAVERILGEHIHRGLVVVKYGHLAPVRKVLIREAAHPVPDSAGLSASLEMNRLLRETVKSDLVICLLSGGGSALLPCPAPPVTLEDKQIVTNLLLASGADIGEINCVRKHLSLMKGGGLARAAWPAQVVTLILSDVVGDPLDVIASGPTVGDPTTFGDAIKILNGYGLMDSVPDTVRNFLADGDRGKHPETPKPGDRELEDVVNVLIGTNATAVGAAEKKAAALGYNTSVLSASITGETRTVAASHARTARELSSAQGPVPSPACVLSGGETTSIVRGSGKGGRNQEFALASGIEIEGLEKAVILSGGTDGTDGPTDAAGAVADGTTAARARSLGMDPAVYLENNDAYHFFEKLGDLLITGPTLTNVMDLHVILVG